MSGIGSIASSAAPFVSLGSGVASAFSQSNSQEEQGQYARQQGDAQASAYEYNAGVSRQQAEAAARAYEYNAALSRNNVLVAKENAMRQAQVTQVEVNDAAREGRGHIGKLRTQIGASGVAMEGTALLVLDEDIRTVNKDMAKIQMAGDQATRNYMIEAANLESEARLNEYNASVARVSGNNQASQEMQRAAVSRYQGQMQEYQANKQSSTTLWSGLSTSFGKFGSMLGGK